MKMYYTTVNDAPMVRKFLVSYDPNCIKRFGGYMFGTGGTVSPLEQLKAYMYRLTGVVDQTIEMLPSNQENAYNDDEIKVQSL